jgi:hypothetical protein
MHSLLSVSADAKTIKGESVGYLTGILYLAPYTSGGIGNLCAFASPGCIASCLFTAGRGTFPNVRAGRIRRTEWFHGDRAGFMAQLVRDIAALVRKAERLGLTPAVRLNGTSDVTWENVRIDGRSVFEMFPNVRFYDYTKNPRRMRAYLAGRLPSNYSLTFSRSECNDADAVAILANGGNVAVVFSTARGKALPLVYASHPIIDGDVSDTRFLDARGVVVGLRAKGEARKDTSGFVVGVAA